MKLLRSSQCSFGPHKPEMPGATPGTAIFGLLVQPGTTPGLHPGNRGSTPRRSTKKRAERRDARLVVQIHINPRLKLSFPCEELHHFHRGGGFILRIE
jgi:hypothetical protein